MEKSDSILTVTLQIETEGMFSVKQRQHLSKITLYQLSGTGIVMLQFRDVLLQDLASATSPA